MFYLQTVIRITALAMALVLSACASTPDYAPADNADDFGHHSTRLSDDRYRIVFNGSSSTGLNTTRDYALLRAAELTLLEGNDWFEVVDRESNSVRRSHPTTGIRHERAYYVERSCGLLSCRQSVRPATYTRVDFAGRPSKTKYSHVLEIVMGKGELPAGGGNFYNARSIAQSLRAAM